MPCSACRSRKCISGFSQNKQCTSRRENDSCSLAWCRTMQGNAWYSSFIGLLFAPSDPWSDTYEAAVRRCFGSSRVGKHVRGVSQQRCDNSLVYTQKMLCLDPDQLWKMRDLKGICGKRCTGVGNKNIPESLPVKTWVSCLYCTNRCSNIHSWYTKTIPLQIKHFHTNIQSIALMLSVAFLCSGQA